MTRSQERLGGVELSASLQDDLDLDVAIIGAGTSGLYTAYRLMSADDFTGSVQIFEGSDRIGGRLESVTLPGMEISGELGGMRYMSSQTIVTTLIEQVFRQWLNPIPFPMGDPAHLLVYLRKQRLQADAWDQAQARGEQLITRYMLNEDDLGLSADQLFNKIVYDVLKADPWFEEHYGSKISVSGQAYSFELTREDWDVIKPQLTYCLDGPYKGIPVWQLGFWNMIKDRASQEGYEFLAAGGGYFSNTINWNAAEALPYMVGDFSNTGTEYKTIEGGYEQIATAMALAYMQHEGAKIWIQNKLISFDYAPKTKARRYALSFYNEGADRRWTVYTDRIILAMPRRSLELLDQQNFFFDAEHHHQLQTNVASVYKEPSFKILMGFEQPWWREDFEADAGHSITDLPMRQCYYFGVDPDDSHSLFLGSYNDMRTVTFWEVLASQPERFKPRATRLVSQAALEPIKDVQASRVMVDELMRQVRELHGRQDIPDPYVTWYKDWTQDPYGGGYHAWKANMPVWDVMPYMRQPFDDEAVHIIGEAYSDQQGWVEGALCVAEKLLQQNLGLSGPSWLNPDYYLGY